MRRICAALLVLGDGRITTRAEQLQEARDRLVAYEIQEASLHLPDGGGCR